MPEDEQTTKPSLNLPTTSDEMGPPNPFTPSDTVERVLEPTYIPPEGFLESFAADHHKRDDGGKGGELLENIWHQNWDKVAEINKDIIMGKLGDVVKDSLYDYPKERALAYDEHLRNNALPEITNRGVLGFSESLDVDLQVIGLKLGDAKVSLGASQRDEVTLDPISGNLGTKDELTGVMKISMPIG